MTDSEISDYLLKSSFETDDNQTWIDAHGGGFLAELQNL
jgi:hypothetical protein